VNAVAQLRFALRSLERDRSVGELRVLALALVVAVASVTAVGFFTDRIGRAVERQAADVLAADLFATSGIGMPDDIEPEARERGLATARHVRFPSVVVNEQDESQLVAVKAVTDGYPLRGAVSLAPLDDAGATESVSGDPARAGGTGVATAPAEGTVWVDPQLVSALALEAGDSLTLGASDFVVERLLLFEPDRGENAFEFAPRVMMNAADLERSELLGPASRARFTVLMAGEIPALDGIRDWIEDRYPDEVRVQDVRDGSPQLKRALDRARRFLGLASVVTVLLAGAAVALAVRHFAQRQADASAVMRTLGATRREVVVWLVLRLTAIAMIASVVGVIVGWFAQLVLARLLAGWFGFELPAPGLTAPLVGTLTAFVSLAGFGLLPVLRAGRVNVMRVLQRDFGSLDGSAAFAVALGLFATYAVVLLLSRDALLSAIVVAGVVVMLAVFGLFGRLMIRGVRVLAGPAHRLSVAGLERRAASSIVQLAAFAMGIMALLLIAIVRVDLLAAWERDLPPEAPNVFVVNLQETQVRPFAERLAAQGIELGDETAAAVSDGSSDVPGIYPMVRARLVAHDGEPVLEDEGDERQRARARREYNLSYADALPPGNELVDGEWWATDGSAPPLLSIESEWAGERGYAVGDTLTFRVAGVETSATIANLRKVDWESFDVNFFVLASPSALAGMPATWVTSFHTDERYSTATAGWAREFPGIATIDIGAVIARVKTLMERASVAIEYVFLFTLMAGLCVLLAAVQSSQSERIRESALLRALGASHAQVRRSVVMEFAILGGIAGVLASLFASAVAWALSRFVFELPFHVNVWMWVIGVAGGAFGIAVAGYLATRRVLHTPPIVALRHGG